MKGVRYLFHVAADYRLWAPDPEEIVRNNDGDHPAVMEAALAPESSGSSTPSSVATLKPRAGGPADETSAADARRRRRRLQAHQGRSRAAGRGMIARAACRR